MYGLKDKTLKRRKEYATQCDYFDEIISLVIGKYGFSLSNSHWMGLREMAEENIEF